MSYVPETRHCPPSLRHADPSLRLRGPAVGPAQQGDSPTCAHALPALQWQVRTLVPCHPWKLTRVRAHTHTHRLGEATCASLTHRDVGLFTPR